MHHKVKAALKQVEAAHRHYIHILCSARWPTEAPEIIRALDKWKEKQIALIDAVETFGYLEKETTNE